MALEFVLVLPFLVAITLGVLDLGGAFTRQMAVQMAAEAGLQYALTNGYNVVGIDSAVSNATTYGVSASPAPALSCGCNSGTAVTAASCGSTCPNGNAAGQYVTVSTSLSYDMILNYPTFSNPLTLTGEAIARIQ